MIRPSGTSAKAQFWQAVYDDLMRRRPRQSLGFLTDCTTRGVHRRPVFQQPENNRLEKATFRATWNFESVYKGESINPFEDHKTQVVEVEGGFGFNSTVEERRLISENKIKEAIQAPLTGDANSYLLAQGQLFNPGTRQIRVRLTVTPPAKQWKHSFFNGVFQFQQNYLYLRLCAMPFFKSQVSDAYATGGYTRPALTYMESQSSEGFHLYECFNGIETTNDAVILPDASILGILYYRDNQTYLLKPRPTWGKTWIALNETSRVVLISKVQNSGSIQIYQPIINVFRTGEYTSSNGRFDGQLPHNTVVAGGQFIPSMDGFKSSYLFQIVKQPTDGENIIFSIVETGGYIPSSQFSWTWKDIVSDPSIEIQIGGLLEESISNFKTFFAGRQSFFASNSAFGIDAFSFDSSGMVLFVYAPGIAATADPTGSYYTSASEIPTTLRLSYGDVSSQYPQLNYSSPKLQISAGSWASIAAKNQTGYENTWRPEDNCWNHLDDFTLTAEFKRLDWMALPLTEGSYDKIISIPQFETPFVIQAFYAGLIFDLNEPIGSQHQVTLEVNEL